jgi:hypothetical protein
MQGASENRIFESSKLWSGERCVLNVNAWRLPGFMQTSFWPWPSFHRRQLGAFLPMLLLLFAGCGSRSDRLAVSGEVTLDGAAVDAGSIHLTSTGNGKLFASGTMIQNGTFHIPQEKGLPPGKYRVEISSPDTAAPLAVYKGAPGEPALPPTAPERIPPEYNYKSKQTVEVTTDGDNHFKFDIVRHGSR